MQQIRTGVLEMGADVITAWQCHCNSVFPPLVTDLPRCFHPQTSQQWSWSHFQSHTGSTAFHIHLHYRLLAAPEQKYSQVRNTEQLPLTAAHNTWCLAVTPVIKVCVRSSISSGCKPTFLHLCQGTGLESTASSGRLWSWGRSRCVCW